MFDQTLLITQSVAEMMHFTGGGCIAIWIADDSLRSSNLDTVGTHTS